MAVQIITAEPHHAPQISIVIKRAFEEDANPETIAAIIETGSHHTWVAISDDAVVGFVDSFLTNSLEVNTHAELDLLAVNPDYQGQGIGKQLIQTFTQSPILAIADDIRTLIRVDNTAMQRAISQCGYTSDKNPHTLYIAATQANETILPKNSHILAVNTFIYSGIWLEGDISEAAIQYAQNQRDKNDLEIVGVAVPKSDTSTVDLLKKQQFEAVKDYHWWFNRFN